VKALRWIAARLKDLFYGVGNNHLDHGRVAAFICLATLIAATAYNMRLRQPIDLGPGGLGGGLGAVLTAAVIYMFKDRQKGGGDVP
jgi:hypothetical protein